jgi:ATP-binding cassette subfamily G (WHITE) protein 2
MPPSTHRHNNHHPAHPPIHPRAHANNNRSCAAASVLAHVRRMALQSDQSVLVSIHQPAAALWDLFDSVTLLASGRLVYNGPAAGLAPWLGAALRRSYDPSVHGLPPDFALGLVSVAFANGGGGGTDGTVGRAITAADLNAAADLFRAQQRAAEAEAEAGAAAGNTPLPLSTRSWPAGDAAAAPAAAKPRAPGRRAGRLAQLPTLFRRELLLVTRNPADVAGRTLSFIWTATLVGFCFYAMPDSAAGVRGRLNILFSSLCFLLLMPFLSTSLLAAGKAAYIRDVSAGVVDPLPYYLAKTAATLPFGVLSSACFQLTIYGMTGLRHGAAAAAQSCVLGVMGYLIGAQVRSRLVWCALWGAGCVMDWAWLVLTR